MSSAFRYLPHYTIEQYQAWEGDWELWQGIPVAMIPSPFGRHQRVAKNLVVELDNQLRDANCHSVVLYEIDWIVADDTVVRPDVVVICGPPPVKHVESTPSLIAEIQSDSTVDLDRNAKRALYDELGVAVYLLVDPDRQIFEINRRNAAGKWDYELVEESVSFTICDDCHLEIDKASLFR